jgi:hypothetical protein
VNQANGDGRNVVASDPKRFAAIRRCWDLMLTGKHTPAEIRQIANTAWGFKTIKGTPLGRSTIYSIFGNPCYHGVFEYPKGTDAWYTGRHTPMVTEEEFNTVQRLLSRAKKLPRNRKVFAFTPLMRCGGCDSPVTAEDKHQLICSRCRLKFAHRSKEACPGCKLLIAKMNSPRQLHYTYYHCTKSGNPDCTERGIERRELERQVVCNLATIRLPSLHELWLNRATARLSGIPEEVDTLTAIRTSFVAGTPEIQRQIAMTIFSTVTLKDQKISAALKPPFSFRERELPGSFDQNALGQETMKEQVARP